MITNIVRKEDQRCLHVFVDFVRKLLLTVGSVAVLVFSLVNATQSHAQSPAQGAATLGPSYEVASIKPNRSDGERIALYYTPNGFIAANVTLRVLIRFAYGPVEENRILGGPDWLTSEKYDIQAKVDSSIADELQKLSPVQLRLQRQRMLQALLADRFKLTVNRETRELPVYALIIGKNGPKLKESKPSDTYTNGLRGPDGSGGPGLYAGNVGLLTGQGVSMATLANVLSRQLGRVVLDKTGITGNYDFELRWNPDQSQLSMLTGADNGRQSIDGTPANDSFGPSIFDAVQEQLGLKLESQKAPIEVIVIDHVGKPSEN